MLVSSCFMKNAYGGMHTETVEYKQDGVVLEGYLAYDDSIQGKVPGILIIHEWTGIGPYVKKRAQDIAALGYVAFAADIYGKGIRPKDAKEAAVQAGIYRSDRALMRERAKAGLEALKKQNFVDQKRIAVMGYCFGGGVALELGRSGADIAGIVSFHGNLDTPHPEDANNIKAKILALHGADDPFVTREQVIVFQDEMRAAHVDWQMVIYGNAVHSFTNPDSGNDPSKGAAYNKEADMRSWEAMKLFFKELFS
jgi:dienelactone hydrolase